MITMKDPSVSVYPNRQQMLALIQARAAADLGERADRKSSAASEPEPPYPSCVFHVTD
jgi:hypothetical protein